VSPSKNMMPDFALEVAFRWCVSLLFHSIYSAACFILSWKMQMLLT